MDIVKNTSAIILSCIFYVDFYPFNNLRVLLCHQKNKIVNSKPNIENLSHHHYRLARKNKPAKKEKTETVHHVRVPSSCSLRFEHYKKNVLN